eukprot:COSAG01_NODE_2305_length_7947_cov_76.250127_2_plen_320_part_00
MVLCVRACNRLVVARLGARQQGQSQAAPEVWHPSADVIERWTVAPVSRPAAAPPPMAAAAVAAGPAPAPAPAPPPVRATAVRWVRRRSGSNGSVASSRQLPTGSAAPSLVEEAAAHAYPAVQTAAASSSSKVPTGGEMAAEMAAAAKGDNGDGSRSLPHGWASGKLLDGTDDVLFYYREDTPSRVSLQRPDGAPVTFVDPMARKPLPRVQLHRDEPRPRPGTSSVHYRPSIWDDDDPPLSSSSSSSSSSDPIEEGEPNEEEVASQRRKQECRHQQPAPTSATPSTPTQQPVFRRRQYTPSSTPTSARQADDAFRYGLRS